MRKLMIGILLILVSLSFSSCNNIGSDFIDEINQFQEDNLDMRYIVVTITKTEMAIVDELVEETTKTIVIQYDRNESEDFVRRSSFFDYDNRFGINYNFVEYIYEFPFKAKDFTSYNEEDDTYIIDYDRNNFRILYISYYMMGEINLSDETLDTVRIIVENLDDDKITWHAYCVSLETDDLGEYPLYDMTLSIDYKDVDDWS